MNNTWQYLEVSQRDAALWVTMNRPTLHNAFNQEMIGELTAVFSDVQAATGALDEARVVVLTGAGPSFSAGADLGWMKAMASYTQDENVADALRLAAMLEAIDSCALPVIARVHGAALGGGAGLVAACDIVVASSDAVFGFTEARLGLAPAVIAPFVLRAIGQRQAQALFLMAQRFNAQQAEKIGLVHHVSDKSQLDYVVDECVASIAACGPEALRACQGLVMALPEMGKEQARAYTAATIAALRASPEGQEGMRAFLEKRPPCFARS